MLTINVKMVVKKKKKNWSDRTVLSGAHKLRYHDDPNGISETSSQHFKNNSNKTEISARKQSKQTLKFDCFRSQGIFFLN